MRQSASYMGSPFQAELILLGYYLSHYHGLFTCYFAYDVCVCGE